MQFKLRRKRQKLRLHRQPMLFTAPDKETQHLALKYIEILYTCEFGVREVID